MRSKLWLGTLVMLLVLLVPQQALAATVNPEASSIKITSGATGEVDVPVALSISLKDDTGASIVPTAGKVYIWANKADGTYTDALHLYKESVPQGTFVHGNYADGVLLGDAKSMGSDVNFSVYFSKPGDYILNAVYFSADTTFDINYANYYWPYMLQKSSEAERSISISAKTTSNPTPPTPTPEPEQPSQPTPPASGGDQVPASNKVGYAFFNGFVDDQSIVSMPIFAGGTTPTDKALPLPDDGETLGKVELLLYQPDGYPVANGTPVTVEGAPGIKVVGSSLQTNALGRVSFQMQGSGEKANYVIVTVGGSWKVKVPVSAYAMGPKRVMLVIGSNAMDVDGQQVNMDVAPLIHKKRTYVPFRALGEVIGGKVVYNKAEQSVTFTNGKRALIMHIDSNRYTLNGQVYEMDAKPFIQSRRTYVPLRFISEAFGYDVEAIRGQSGTAAIVLTR